METSFVTLQGHQLHRLSATARLRTESGLLWVTVDGELEDILLAPGESRSFNRPGAAVVAYALGGTARFEVVAPAAEAGFDAPSWLARMQAWWHGSHPAHPPIGRGA
jgi:hypothetical protein